MKKRKLLALSLAALLSAAVLIGCDFVDFPEEESLTETEVIAEEPADTKIHEIETEKYIYCPIYQEVEFISDGEKAAWREPLLRLLSNEVDKWYDISDETIETGSGPVIRRGWYVGLYDVNLDGVPELLMDMGGGSAGNALYVVYDLYTGYEYEDYLDGNYDGGWSVYLNTETGAYENIGRFAWRMGYQGRNRYVYKGTIMSFAGRPTLISMPCFGEEYRIEWPEAGDMDQLSCRTGTSDSDVAYCDRVSFFVQEKAVSPDEYFEAYDDFANTYVRIPGTDLKLFWREDYEDVEELIDDLIGSGQSFIRPASDGDA